MADASVPVPTPETRPFWDAAAEGRLSIQRCTDCERAYFYPRPQCPHCASEKVEWFTASGRGTLTSYVIGQKAVPGFEPPFVIALVTLEEGPRMMSNVVHCPATPEALRLDMPLQVTFEQRGDVALPLFEPMSA